MVSYNMNLSKLRKVGDGNIVFSEASLLSLGGILHAAAQNNTQKELNVINGTVDIPGGAIALWVQESASKDSFKYFDKVNSVNFLEDGVKDKVNIWVSNATNKMIPSLFDKEFSKRTRFCAVSALYFTGDWDFQAKSYNFNGFTEKKVIPFIEKKETFEIADNDKYTAVKIWYKDNCSYFVVVMPKNNDFENISVDKIDFKSEEILFSMPKLNIEDSHDLIPYLQSIGVVEAFSGGDFGGLTDLPIDLAQVFQKVRIELDEKGTKAAAATVAVGYLRCIRLEPRNVKIDKPYLFFINKEENGVTHNLFSGRIEMP